MNAGTARNTVGSLSPKNSNETDGEVQRQLGLLASPGRVPFDVKSCLILLCVSAFVLGRQKAVPFQQ